jgi:hypothetical protein
VAVALRQLGGALGRPPRLDCEVAVWEDDARRHAQLPRLAHHPGGGGGDLAGAVDPGNLFRFGHAIPPSD